MSDDCIVTVREIIKARLIREHESLNSELRAVKFDYANRHTLGSTMYQQKVRSVCRKHLQTRAQVIFEALEENLIGPLVFSAELKQKLKAEFLTHIDAHANIILAASMDHGIYLLKTQLIAEYNAKIDLLCRKLESEANKRPPQIVINNLFQTGQGNQAIQGDGNVFSGSNRFDNTPEERQNQIRALENLIAEIRKHASKDNPEISKTERSLENVKEELAEEKPHVKRVIKWLETATIGLNALGLGREAEAVLALFKLWSKR